ncbi:hypothetical protein Poli38472_000596 [Pythium oligandrum]|uniref:Protein kinase domain-containing protein n=1 Tax=Pythium oligandrum TaxID=41045 RepID=A0A8K1FH09_PYTOL|nr:hypothetical protein Poli38472_000596 [Pythium oligandrum]|eukprot:TMW60554.1 hypothetical protein Poli38472_000596 [Pythium oligandrum]
MNRYEVLERLGDGSFGEVNKARSLKTNEIVAIKKIKALFPTWEECLQLRELKSLRVLRHENVVQLKEVIRDKEELYFVFEYMHSSLFKVMRQLRHQLDPSEQTSTSIPSGWLTEVQIKSMMYQLFSGLAYMHKHGFFHRDIKPENLLCHEDTLKIADLGQAREIRSRPPFTDYVATRWYRSPELLLRATTYNSPIDLWACGCIMAELFLQTPLFPGTSETDQLARICRVLGPPTKETWPEGIALSTHLQFKFPKCAPVPWQHVLPAYTSKLALQLISELLQFDPSRRLTAAQALQHRYFDQQVPRPILVPTTAPTTARSSSPVGKHGMALPLKAPGKASGAGDSQSKKLQETDRWKDTAATSSHGDTMVSARRGYEATSTAWTPWEKATARGGYEEKADAKTQASLSLPLGKKHHSSDSSATWYSARKWTGPEEGGGDTDMDTEPAESQEKPTRGRGHKTHDNLLQDLLDDLLT